MIHADSQVDHRQIVRVMDIAKQTSIEHIGVAVCGKK